MSFEGFKKTFQSQFYFPNEVQKKVFTPHLIDNILGSHDSIGRGTQLASQMMKKDVEKKTRTSFNPHQISRLENDFLQKKYLTPKERIELANELGMH